MPHGLSTLFVVMTGSEEAMSIERPGNGGYRFLKYKNLDSAQAEVWRPAALRFTHLPSPFRSDSPAAWLIAQSTNAPLLRTLDLWPAHGPDLSMHPSIGLRYVDCCDYLSLCDK